MSARSKHCGVWPLAFAWAVGCGGSQAHPSDVFTTTWEDDAGRSISALQQKLSSTRIAPGANLALGVGARGLVGLRLENAARWEFAHALNARPRLAGHVVVGSGAGEVFALDADSGRLLWSHPTGARVTGAGDDGRTTVVVLEPTNKRATMLLAVSHDGDVLREIETGESLGSPAVVSGFAFVPWQDQYVSAYDVAGDREIARITLRTKTSHARVIGGGLYFGEIGWTRFDGQIGLASRGQANFVALPSRELPGAPTWMPPGALARAPKADARDRIRLFARPSSPDAPIGIDNQRYYATYYRIVVGLHAATGELQWVRTLEHDVIGGAAYVGGFAACADSGTLSLLDAATGGASGELSFGQPLLSCVVQADTWTRDAAAASHESLAQQIANAIRVGETDMVMMQRFLLRELVGAPDEIATKILIDLASNPRTSPALMGDVRTGLSARRNGEQHMLAALDRPYDFLADVLLPPPVGPLADALAAMQARAAAPALTRHLNDPADSDDDVMRAARALDTLATNEQLQELKSFFALYRSSAGSEELTEAVVSVARAILRLSGETGRQLVADAARDPMTQPALAPRLEALVHGPSTASD